MQRLLVCCVLVLALSGLSCPADTELEISTSDDAISVSAHLVENGVMMENTGEVDCLIIVDSPEGEQRFEVPVGENMTVTDITPPIEVVAVSL